MALMAVSKIYGCHYDRGKKSSNSNEGVRSSSRRFSVLVIVFAAVLNIKNQIIETKKQMLAASCIVGRYTWVHTAVNLHQALTAW